MSSFLKDLMLTSDDEALNSQICRCSGVRVEQRTIGEDPLSRTHLDTLGCINIHNIYSETSLSRPTTGAILSGPFREVVGLGSWKL